LNKYLPTSHGFDEFFGYLYHLDAMSDPYWFDYPQDWIDKYGPRDLVHCWATDADDPTEMPRWGKVGKRRIVGEGPLAPFPDMAQLDDSVGALLKHLQDISEADNTIVIFTTDNGAEVFTWPDGGMTPFKATKGTSFEGGFRVPCIIRWPGKIKPGTIENGIFSGLDWLPTLVDAAGNPDIKVQLLKGVKLGDRTYKNHLDGYDQMELLLGNGPSARHELFYFAGPKLGAL